MEHGKDGWEIVEEHRSPGGSIERSWVNRKAQRRETIRFVATEIVLLLILAFCLFMVFS